MAKIISYDDTVKMQPRGGIVLSKFITCFFVFQKFAKVEPHAFRTILVKSRQVFILSY